MTDTIEVTPLNGPPKQLPAIILDADWALALSYQGDMWTITHRPSGRTATGDHYRGWTERACREAAPILPPSPEPAGIVNLTYGLDLPWAIWVKACFVVLDAAQERVGPDPLPEAEIPEGVSLYGVELTRTESAVCYVLAASHEEAEAIATKHESELHFEPEYGTDASASALSQSPKGDENATILTSAKTDREWTVGEVLSVLAKRKAEVKP